MSIYPLTGWQNYLIGVEERRAENATFLRMMTLGQGLLIKPGISLRRVKRAFQKICARHDVMRCRFHQMGGVWRCSILETYPGDIRVHNYTGVAFEEIESIVLRHATEMIPLDGPVTAQLDLLKFGPHGDAIVFRAHHAITDGFGLMILFEDLISVFMGLPLRRPVMSYGDYIQNWNKEHRPEPDDTRRYWEDKLQPLPKRLNIGRVKRGLPILCEGLAWRQGRSVIFELDAAQTEAFAGRAHKAGVSPFMLALAAYLQSLGRMADSEDVLYAMTLGRSDGPLSHYAGHHTLHPLMRHRHRAALSVEACAQETAAELLSAMQHLPAAAARRTGDWDQRLLQAGGYPRHLTVGGLSSQARLNVSAFSELFSLSNGVPLDVGRFTITKYEPQDSLGGLDELNFRPNFDGRRAIIKFKHDAEAYTPQEIDGLVSETLTRLDLVAGSPRILEDPPVPASMSCVS